MAAEQLQIEIKANVQQAVGNLKQLQTQLGATGKAANVVGNQSFPALAKGSGQATQALTNTGRILQDLPFGIIGVANNIDPLIQSFVYLKKETGSTGAAISALGSSLVGGGGLVLAISVVTSALQFFALSQRGAGKAVEESKQFTDSYVSSLTEQKLEFEGLVRVVKDATQTEVTRNRALERLNEILPDTIGKLTRQNIATAEGAAITAQYIKAIEARATAELLVNRIAENNIKLFDNRNKVLKTTADLDARILQLRAKAESLRQRNQFEAAFTVEAEIAAAIAEQNKAKTQGNRLSNELLKLNQQLRNEYEAQLPTTLTLGKTNSEVTKKTKERAEAQILVSNAILRDTQELQKQAKVLDQLNSIIELQRKTQRERSVGATTADITGLRDLSGGQTNIERLDALAGEFIKVNEQAKLVSDTINNGINQGIDTFFNALANNQDPFKALVQSVQRLVVELGAAVVKSLILKTIANSIAPGSGLAVGGLQGLSSTGLVRGDMLALALTRGG